MTPMQFVSCNDESCPFNTQRTCRAPWLTVDENGKCMIRENGPFTTPSATEQYVEIRSCSCQKCNNWEVDEATGVGTCGLRDSLAFVWHKNPDVKETDQALGPVCTVYEKQIAQPGFTAPNVG